MAQLEITDKDIATIEQLHDGLYGLVGMPAELHGRYRNLIARMYNAINEVDKPKIYHGNNNELISNIHEFSARTRNALLNIGIIKVIDLVEVINGNNPQIEFDRLINYRFFGKVAVSQINEWAIKNDLL